MEAMADGLGVGPRYVQAVYEDDVEWEKKKDELPVNVTPEDSKIEDSRRASG